MKKISKKNIVILIVLITLLIIQIKAFRDSTANKIIDITAKIVDSNGLLSDEDYIIQAVNEGESGVSIALPNIVNTKKVSKYLVVKKEIIKPEIPQEEVENTASTENTISADNTTSTENTISTENTTSAEKTTSTEDTIETGTTEEKNTIVEMLPGDKLYLTQEEIDNKQIELIVEYDTTEVETQILYNKRLTFKDNDEYELFSVSGYMPNETKIEVSEADISNVQDEIVQNYPNNFLIRKL